MIPRQDFDTPGDAPARPHDNCYWLLPGRVLAAEHPLRGDAAPGPRLRALRAAGFTHFVDLSGAAPYAPADALRLAHPIVDFGIPTAAGMRAALDDITAALAGGGVVYLHCMAGVGRTGTVAACLLVEHGFTAPEALALLQRKWRVAGQRVYAARTPETAAQRAFVATWRRPA